MNAVCDPRSMPIMRPGMDDKPKRAPRKPRRTEHDLQCQIVDLIRSRLGNEVEFAAIPNGARVAPREAKKLKAEGLMAGLPDLWLMNPLGITFFIEVKTPKGRLSEAQKAFGARMRARNIGYCVARSVEDAETFLVRFGLIRRAPS